MSDLYPSFAQRLVPIDIFGRPRKWKGRRAREYREGREGREVRSVNAATSSLRILIEGRTDA
jgi:hypothetical protein